MASTNLTSAAQSIKRRIIIGANIPARLRDGTACSLSLCPFNLILLYLQGFILTASFSCRNSSDGSRGGASGTLVEGHAHSRDGIHILQRVASKGYTFAYRHGGEHEPGGQQHSGVLMNL